MRAHDTCGVRPVSKISIEAFKKAHIVETIVTGEQAERCVLRQSCRQPYLRISECTTMLDVMILQS